MLTGEGGDEQRETEACEYQCSEKLYEKDGSLLVFQKKKKDGPLSKIHDNCTCIAIYKRKKQLRSQSHFQYEINKNLEKYSKKRAWRLFTF